MKLIVGLGNPGDKYKKTRHNLGFMVIDFLIRNEQFDSKKVKLIKPETFMNNSGQAVKVLADYYKIPTKEILVIHDDIDLPLGEIRIQQGRGAAGHKGVQSIINQLGTKDFIRMRIGIKPSEEQIIETENFVLKNFTSSEEKIVQATIKKAADLITATF